MPSFPSPEPMVSCIDDLDFFKEFENEFLAIVYNDALTSKSDFLSEPTISIQHINEFNLKDEISLSECDDSKSDKDNDDDKIDIKQSSGDADKHVPTIFDYEIMKAILNDALSNQFKNAEEYAYRLEQTTNFIENQIVWKSRQEDIRRPIPRPLIFFRPQRNPNEPPRIIEVFRITTDQPHGLDFMEQIIMIKEDDKPYSFSEADFKYLNKNNIEDLYYLCRNKKLGIESYQIKVNLTASTLTFPRIEAHEPFSIVDKPSTGLIYLNSKDEKRVMYLIETVKFCDAILEKVLKEVKLKIFQSEP
ncbi:hypothetical protein Tco_0420531 [Tanacetum coccineum]